MLTVLEVTLPVFALVLCGWIAARRGLMSEAAVEGINAFVFWFALPAMLYRAVAVHPISSLLDLRYLGAYLLAGTVLFLATLLIARGRRAQTPRGASRSRSPRPTATSATSACRCSPSSATRRCCRDGDGDDGRHRGADRRDDRALRARPQRPGRGRRVHAPPVAAARRAGRTAAHAADPGHRRGPRGLGHGRDPARPGRCVRAAARAGRRPVRALRDRRLARRRRVVLDRDVGALLAAKLVAHPALVGAAMWATGAPPALAAVGVLAAALPAASNTFILSQRYGVDTRAIGAAIVVGTFAAAATVSFVIWLLGLRPA
jgi:malonate transporter and related proteins